MSYRFIEPLKEKPKIVKKKYWKKSLAQLILEEFLESDLKYARVPYEKVKEEYKSPAFCSRAIGRVITTLKREKEVSVVSDEKAIYLEKLK